MPFPIISFFWAKASAQRIRSVGRGRSKCPSYHPPTPYTLSPLFKGGEGRGEGGSYTHVPCPFGALLVTLCQIFSKRFLNGKGDMGGASPHWARPPCGRARPSPLHIKKALASKWY
jgi:hypothetical protein